MPPIYFIADGIIGQYKKNVVKIHQIHINFADKINKW